VSSTKFAFSLFLLDICILPYLRANNPPTLNYDSSRGTSYMSFLFYFDSKLHSATSTFFSMPPLFPLCRLSFLFLVPSFNCTWYLDPFLHAFTKSFEAAGCCSTTSVSSHSLDLPSILHSTSSIAQLIPL
jgi:hypothetical protein